MKTMTTNISAYYAWRDRSSILNKIILALAMAAFTGLFAQIAIHLPNTPVPITGQTFAVLMSGIVLGRKWGGVSQVLYVGLGALGLPWFAGLSGGGAILLGATGGYLLGFILASWFLGTMIDRRPDLRAFFPLVGLMWFASFVLIQVPGLIGLSLWMSLVKGQSVTFYEVVSLGMLPFVIGDVIKILMAAGLARALVPQKKS
jgi:biotin transport system substrate-specific component